jgi:hypothetical protein
MHYVYPGNELNLFAQAKNYKRHLFSYIKKFIRGNVLEVGAGIGANISYLLNDSVSSWTCLEPDESLFDIIPDAVQGFAIKKIHGTIYGITGRYNTILYIDVLEHIENDADELSSAARLAMGSAPRGRIVVVSPAHNHLFSPFDKNIGHYRRYSKRDMMRLVPQGFYLKSAFYLDSVGYFLSLANHALLGQSSPTLRQIQFWDRVIIPLSRCFDVALRNSFGKTIAAVFEYADCKTVASNHDLVS